MKTRKLLSLIMAVLMLLSLVPAAMADEQAVTTVTVYPPDATTNSGNPPDYINQFFVEEGLDVQVWAYSPEKTNAILSSGDLPDVMYVTYKDLQTMIEGGMVLNLEEHLEKMPHVTGDPVIMTAVYPYTTFGVFMPSHRVPYSLIGRPCSIGNYIMSNAIGMTRAVQVRKVDLLEHHQEVICQFSPGAYILSAFSK